MELRRSGGPEGDPELPAGDPPREGKKPVIIYILVLFAAAFLLMALSFFMHQRSNEEVMGRLQSSVSAMQELQNSQETIAQLQKDLEAAQEAAKTFELALDGATDVSAHTEQRLERTQEAMEWFWQLDESFLRGDLEMCREICEKLEDGAETPLTEYLTPLAAERYREIAASLEEGPSSAEP